MKLIAVTSCPMGIAHTYMAAEALQIAAENMGHNIKVETHGAIGVENEISKEEILAADAVIISADKAVDKSRFNNKVILEVSTQEVIKNAREVVDKALDLVKKKKENEQAAKETQNVKELYKHLLTGISFMVPFAIINGIFASLTQFIRIYGIKGFFADILNKISFSGIYQLELPILSGYIAYSIADTLGIAPGIILGYIIGKTNLGIFGALISGFLCGYIAKILKKYVKMPKNLNGLVPSVIVPIITTFAAAVILLGLLNEPLQFIDKGIIFQLNYIGKVEGAFLGIILGAMMAFDAGGPINKIAFIFAVSALAIGQQKEMAAVMAAGMTPPIGIGLAALIFKNKFSDKEKKSAMPAIVLGSAFVTEGVIPFIKIDSKNTLPAIVLGSAASACLSMVFNCTMASPLGGIYVFIIPNVVGNLLLYLAAIAVGVIITVICIVILKTISNNISGRVRSN
ncbi:MAG: fructose-specific PTS transporter subunit EIIC [Bacillota bacterium]|nr:fructose-specific PTS transporter subunit EIIC [Bacillota bacterium]